MLQKYLIFFKDCHLLCFSREEEFSAVPYKNEVADEETPGTKGNTYIKEEDRYFGASRQMFGPSCFVRAIDMLV